MIPPERPPTMAEHEEEDLAADARRMAVFLTEASQSPLTLQNNIVEAIVHAASKARAEALQEAEDAVNGKAYGDAVAAIRAIRRGA